MVVKLLGGLGNQLFQYAFGQALSLYSQKTVKYDISELVNRSISVPYTIRDYELDVFDTQIKLATDADVAMFKNTQFNFWNKSIHRIKRKMFDVHYVNESELFLYDENVFKYGNNTYFDGYWQNELYFKIYRNEIIRDLTLKNPLSGLNLELADRIEQAPIAVSLHVRRGDYVYNKLANEVHGTCSFAYYERAVKLLKERFGEINLFIFSDEPDWVKANMKFSALTTYINHNFGKSSVEDLRLMSLCNHNIIANSSFSWWGAWLNTNIEKVVIAPKSWFQVNMKNSPVPVDWISF